MATFKLSDSDQLIEAVQSAGPSVSARQNSFRQEAAARFKQLGLPTLKQEDWRFFSVKPIAETSFEPAYAGADAAALMEQAEIAELISMTPHLAVLVNGAFRDDLSSISNLPGFVTVRSFSASENNQAFTNNFGTIATDNSHPFMALNSAGFGDGLFIEIKSDSSLEDPIHILSLTSASDAVVSNPRVLVVAETGSKLTLVETHYGPNELSYLTNPVVEISVAENANVDHYRLQFDGTQAFHTATLDARQAASSQFSTQTFTFGGKLTRNDVGLHMDGENGHGTMNGLYQLSGNQVVDNHTRIDHAYPNCETHELFKGVLDGHARGVFNGRIMVRQIAQKTDSKQTNRTLLLSSDALINTNPQLEIFADDVKCTHGATIGQLEENQLYYLRSRGISETESRRILVFAFANDVVEKVAFRPLQEYLEKRLLASQAEQNTLVKA